LHLKKEREPQARCKPGTTTMSARDGKSAKSGSKTEKSSKSKPKAAKPKSVKAPKAETGAAPEVEARQDSGPKPGAANAFDPQRLTAEQMDIVEKLSANLARAAVTAQGAIAEAALRQAERPSALSADPFHVSSALTDVMGRLSAQPERLVRAQADLFQKYMELWQSAARRASGETVPPVVEPAKGDKRFLDPDWSENPVFDVIKQSYLVTSNWLNALVSDVEDVEPMTKRRVEFFMKMLTDAFAPSNFLVSNPAALREAVSSRGESLLKGMENFAEDLSRGGGQLAISQTDYDMFKIGENVATAPGKVIFQNEIIQLLQFSPSTPRSMRSPW